MKDFNIDLAELLEVDVVSDQDNLKDFEAWDSLTILSIIAFCDEKFKVTLSAREINDAVTVEGLKTLIKNKNGG